MPNLSVNVDHVATLRQARLGREPDPLEAARAALAAGASGITVHLREDRRHVQDRDVRRLRRVRSLRLNLEMAPTPEMVRIALRVRPHQATLVPERRRELTTEGGLDPEAPGLAGRVRRLRAAGISVSLFVEPRPRALKRAAALGADCVELHTGAYARAFSRGGRRAARPHLARLRRAARLARALGLRVHAGHGLTTANVGPVAAIPGVEDLNIGHHLVARAVFVGLPRAVSEMLSAMRRGR